MEMGIVSRQGAEAQRKRQSGTSLRSGLCAFAALRELRSAASPVFRDTNRCLVIPAKNVTCTR